MRNRPKGIDCALRKQLSSWPCMGYDLLSSFLELSGEFDLAKHASRLVSAFCSTLAAVLDRQFPSRSRLFLRRPMMPIDSKSPGESALRCRGVVAALWCYFCAAFLIVDRSPGPHVKDEPPPCLTTSQTVVESPGALDFDGQFTWVCPCLDCPAVG